MEHGSSKTQKLIYRTSYLKHKQRLLDLRPHPPELPPPRPTRTRDAHSLREVEREVRQLYSTEQMRQEGKRYEEAEECRFEMKSDFNDGEPVRCVLPVAKMRANSFASGQKGSAQQSKRNGLTNKFKSYGRSDKKFESFNVPRETERSPPALPQPEAYFNLPERNQNRQVIHKKTIMLSPMQSAMLELSLLGERVLIVAYLMGVENFTLRELLSLKRSKDVLRDYADNFEELCCRITVERINGKYAALKVSEGEEREKVENTAKLKAKVQNDFIKRNYYTLLKSEEEIPVKERPSVSKEKVQAIVERLAVPRKYSKPSEENTPLPPKPLKHLPPPVPYKKPFKSPAYPSYNQINQMSQINAKPQLPEPLKPQFKLNKTEEDVRPAKKTEPKKTQEELPSVQSKNSLNKSKSQVQSIHPKSEVPSRKQMNQQDLIELPLLPRQPADFNEFDQSEKGQEAEELDEEEKFKEEEEQYEEEEQFEGQGDSEEIERRQEENKQEEKYKLEDEEVEYLGEDYDEEFENPSTVKKSDLPNQKHEKTELQPVKESGLYENSFEEDYQQDEFEASKPAPKPAEEDYAQSFEN